MNCRRAARNRPPVERRRASVKRASYPSLGGSRERLQDRYQRNNVEEGASAWSKVRRGLEVALIVLVVLLVVIGLIIGFNRLKGDEDEEGKDETYY